MNALPSNYEIELLTPICEAIVQELRPKDAPIFAVTGLDLLHTPTKPVQPGADPSSPKLELGFGVPVDAIIELVKFLAAVVSLLTAYFALKKGRPQLNEAELRQELARVDKVHEAQRALVELGYGEAEIQLVLSKARSSVLN
jgi:hypothetical protein